MAFAVPSSPSIPPSVSLPADNTPVDLRARISADLSAPDRIAFDLTLRQIAVLAAAGLAALGLWQVMTPWTPVAVRAGALVPVAALGLALAAGRRDGLPLDAWLFAAAVFRRRPRRLLPAVVQPLPSWAPAPADSTAGPGRPPALLRLPAETVDAEGIIRHGGGASMMVASSTVNIALRTPGEQAALVAGFGRWLNGLTTPVQIVVSTRRADLTGHARRLAARSHALASPGLAAAAIDHAEFLLDLSETRDPVQRTVTITATAAGGPSPATTARRAAEHTVTALSAIGAHAAVLDGASATAVLVTASAPYRSSDASWSRVPPDAVVTAAVRPRSEQRRGQR